MKILKHWLFFLRISERRMPHNISQAVKLNAHVHTQELVLFAFMLQVGFVFLTCTLTLFLSPHRLAVRLTAQGSPEPAWPLLLYSSEPSDKGTLLKRLGLLTRRAVILNIYAIIFFRIGLTILCLRENIITWKFQESSRAILKLKWNWFLTNYQVYPHIWFPFLFFFCMSVLLYLFFSVSSPSDYLLFFPLVIISKVK